MTHLSPGWDGRDDAARRRVSDVLGIEIPRGLWNFVTARREPVYQQEAEIHKEDLKNARHLLREIRGFVRRSDTPRQSEAPLRSLDEPLGDRPMPNESERRAEAVSYLVALDVWSQPDVQAFRHDHLPHGLLVYDELEAWIVDQGRLDERGASELSDIELHWQSARCSRAQQHRDSTGRRSREARAFGVLAKQTELVARIAGNSLRSHWRGAVRSRDRSGDHRWAAISRTSTNDPRSGHRRHPTATCATLPTRSGPSTFGRHAHEP